MTEHTPTPWVYRSHHHDDWGWIRDADGNLAATARDGRVWSDQFDAYRAAGTDPYEPNAAFIVKAVNNHDALVAALRAFAVHASYPVSIEINPRGYVWRGQESLDYAKSLADAALDAVGSSPDRGK